MILHLSNLQLDINIALTRLLIILSLIFAFALCVSHGYEEISCGYLVRVEATHQARRHP
jgi:hypothetical protein